ncbi:MAG: aspartate 1-decarboxylase, partial [Planctomycetia bacterium]|nr:aspartate 1-decarboxylase [Planctomycetia bacterium]
PRSTARRSPSADPDHVGSITIDTDLLDATGRRIDEKVLVCDVDSGSRFETCVFKGEPGSGIIGINGVATRVTTPGNNVLVMSFCHMTVEEMDAHRPKLTIIGDGNVVDRMIRYDSA